MTIEDGAAVAEMEHQSFQMRGVKSGSGNAQTADSSLSCGREGRKTGRISACIPGGGRD